MFWQIMAPNAGGEPTGPIADAIMENFGTLVSNSGSGGKQFGSGWVWLVRS